MKQNITAMEWFVEQLPIRIINSYLAEIAKAKTMEREQIQKAFIIVERSILTITTTNNHVNTNRTTK